ncbi:MAG: hypothetical protein Q9190_002774 [Brigantiaea leucoxantha]
MLRIAAFLLLLLFAAYLGLGSVQIPRVNDKFLHFLTFFLLTITFYWVLDTSRRRTLNVTVLIVTVGLAVGSEVLQALLPNGRIFDPLDIAANIFGSLLALGLCTMYHKRMLDRRRRRKGYGVVQQEEAGEDLELGASEPQEQGVVDAEAWDELQGESSAEGEERITPSSTSGGDAESDTKI